MSHALISPPPSFFLPSAASLRVVAGTRCAQISRPAKIDELRRHGDKMRACRCRRMSGTDEMRRQVRRGRVAARRYSMASVDAYHAMPARRCYRRHMLPPAHARMLPLFFSAMMFHGFSLRRVRGRHAARRFAMLFAAVDAAAFISPCRHGARRFILCCLSPAARHATRRFRAAQNSRLRARAKSRGS